VAPWRKAALKGKIKLGEILIAEDESRLPIGYCIFSDRYFKRDEVGIVYQMNVLPGAQRKLVAATLLKAVFEHVPYGCKLFSCWCAQDLDAGYFWEAMGFIPIAFRTGAVGKKIRTHIFWQRRIREGDVDTPYWYPSKTDGGMMREDRIVLPIPPGAHWKDPMPILVPEIQNALPAPVKKERSGKMLKPQIKPVQQQSSSMGRLWFAPAKPVVEKAKTAKPKREKVKADPALVAKARELRDRYLEQFNAGKVLPSAKYDVCKVFQDKPAPRLLTQQAA
jgi:hypothetical protein